MFSDNRWIRDAFHPAGITFTQGTLFHGSFFNGNPTIIFCRPLIRSAPSVSGVRHQHPKLFCCGCDLHAYDVSGKVIASDRILNPGQTFQYQTLSLSSKEAIAGTAVLS
jgi:hypothetical protein